LQQDGKKRSNLVTPYKGNFRGEKLSTLIDFKKVFDWGYAIFSKENKNYPPTIGEWVNAMPFDNDFKTNTLIPFLAADLGTSTEEIKQTSTAEMVKLFAFRKATSSAIFKIMKIGMGTLVQHIGEKLKQSKGVIFKTSSPVKQLSVIAKGYNLVFENVAGTQTQHFDYVIIATHPDQAAKILQSDNQFSNLVSVLKEFPYFKAHIVLHRYDEIVDKKYPSFFNIHIDPQTKMVSNTMNLGIIHPRYKGIYKSWVSDEVYSKIKAEKLMIHEEIFYHPLITPAFISNIATLKERLKQFSNLYISGGWSQGLETQETAILSGKEAAEHYFQWQKTTRQ
jgi:predicted NAD/FAD-binding protein